MRDPDSDTELKLGSPAVYRIVVQGHLDPSFTSRLAGMQIDTKQRGAAGRRPPETALRGWLADQAQLIGVVNHLYEMGLPLLLVAKLENGESTPAQE